MGFVEKLNKIEWSREIVKNKNFIPSIKPVTVYNCGRLFLQEMIADGRNTFSLGTFNTPDEYYKLIGVIKCVDSAE